MEAHFLAYLFDKYLEMTCYVWGTIQNTVNPADYKTAAVPDLMKLNSIRGGSKQKLEKTLDTNKCKDEK